MDSNGLMNGCDTAGVPSIFSIFAQALVKDIKKVAKEAFVNVFKVPVIDIAVGSKSRTRISLIKFRNFCNSEALENVSIIG